MYAQVHGGLQPKYAWAATNYVDQMSSSAWLLQLSRVVPYASNSESGSTQLLGLSGSCGHISAVLGADGRYSGHIGGARHGGARGSGAIAASSVCKP